MQKIILNKFYKLKKTSYFSKKYGDYPVIIKILCPAFKIFDICSNLGFSVVYNTDPCLDDFINKVYSKKNDYFRVVGDLYFGVIVGKNSNLYGEIVYSFEIDEMLPNNILSIEENRIKTDIPPLGFSGNEILKIKMER